MLLTAGERIAMSFLAIAINARGCKAASYTGSQAGIITDTQHGTAQIVEIRPKRILESLGEGNVVIVAGFQGLSTNYDITTLGRGGSDTTAVAMAAAVGAEVCEIYTDVEGVFTADPRIEPTARKVQTISYEEMLELSAAGAKVLSSRSVEYARRHGVIIHVRSSFEDEPGTWVREVDEQQMEGVLISGVALDNDEAKVTLDRVPDRPGVAATVFRAIAGEGISVDMIVQNVSHEGATDLSFTAPLAEIPRLEPVMERVVKEIGATRFSIDDEIAKVSLVGAGMKTHPGVAADIFDALAEDGINIEMISTSPIRISCVIRKADAEQAVRTIHARFELDRDGALADRRAVSLPPPPIPDPPSIPPPPELRPPRRRHPAVAHPAGRGRAARGPAARWAVGSCGAGPTSLSICHDASVTSERFGYCITVPEGWRVAEVGDDLPADQLFRPDGATDADDPGGRYPTRPAGVRRGRSRVADRQRPEPRAGSGRSRSPASTRCGGTPPSEPPGTSRRGRSCSRATASPGGSSSRMSRMRSTRASPIWIACSGRGGSAELNGSPGTMDVL